MDPKKIGARIKEVRRMRGITQAELAVKADVTTKYISNIECGSKTPKFETFVTIANALEIDANTLLSDVLKVAPAIEGTGITEKLSSLPLSEQKRLLRLFDVMINDAKTNI